MILIKNVAKLLVFFILLLLVVSFWGAYTDKESSDFCETINVRDTIKEVRRKAGLKNYRVKNEGKEEVWIYTQPNKTGLYQEGVACVVELKKGKVINKDIRVY